MALRQLFWFAYGSLNDNVDRSTYTMSLSGTLAKDDVILIGWKVVSGGAVSAANSSVSVDNGLTYSYADDMNRAYDTSGSSETIFAGYIHAASATTGTPTVTFTLGGTHRNLQAAAVRVVGADINDPVKQFAYGGPINTNVTSLTATFSDSLRASTSLKVHFVTHEVNELVSNSMAELYDFSASADSTQFSAAAATGTATSATASWATSNPGGSILIEVPQRWDSAGSVTPTGALSTIANYARAAAGSITPNGALSAALGLARTFVGAITPTGALSTLIPIRYRTFTGSITPVGAAGRSLVRNLLKLLSNFTGLALTAETDEITGGNLTAESENSLTLTELPEEDA